MAPWLVLARNALPVAGAVWFGWTSFEVTLQVLFSGVAALAAMLAFQLAVLSALGDERVRRAPLGSRPYGPPLLWLLSLLLLSSPYWFLLFLTVVVANWTLPELQSNLSAILLPTALSLAASVAEEAGRGYGRMSAAEIRQEFKWHFSMHLARICVVSAMIVFLRSSIVVPLLMLGLTWVEIFPMRALRFFGGDKNLDPGNERRGDEERDRRHADAALGVGILLAAAAVVVLMRRPSPPPPPLSGPSRTPPPAAQCPYARRQTPPRRQLLPDSPWTKLDDILPDIMDVRGLPEGVWVVSKYAGFWFPGRALAPAAKIEFHGAVFEAAAGTAEELFLGGWDGGMWRGRVDGAPCVQPPPTGFGRVGVDALAWREGTLYAAWDGSLWTWREGQPAWTRLDVSSSAGRLTAVLPAGDKTLWAGGWEGLWRQEAGGWRQVWKGRGERERVSFLREGERGRVFVGTGDGLLILEDGRIVEHLFEGQWIGAAAEAPEGGFWAGSWQEGLLFWKGGSWHRVPLKTGTEPSFTGIAVDRAGVLWVGVYGSGVYVRPEASARLD
ncbi:MAG TPA: hypothetical protein DCM05_07245 [Elusimicrobia bacterium]|nr:hypothetical protein [Elusimicrobiota bacterium]